MPGHLWGDLTPIARPAHLGAPSVASRASVAPASFWEISRDSGACLRWRWSENEQNTSPDGCGNVKNYDCHFFNAGNARKPHNARCSTLSQRREQNKTKRPGKKRNATTKEESKKKKKETTRASAPNENHHCSKGRGKYTLTQRASRESETERELQDR